MTPVTSGPAGRMGATVAVQLNDDEQHLAELGYKQELNRTWSGFSNFAISFSIISILAGCFTTFGQAWNNGGPIAISIGWPLISVFILIIGFCMSELVSAYPTSGGIYWWASKLGGVKAGYYTGWLNLIGLLAIDASVAYGAATFFDLSFSTMSESWAEGYSLQRVFWLFLVVLVLTALINIFGGHILAMLNNISVWWHVVGAAVIIAILIFLPEKHMSINDVFTMRVNNSGGLAGGETSGLGLLVLRAPARLPAHPVHDHRLRRLGAPVRGDARRRRRCRQGHLALDLLLRHRRLGPPARLPLRRPGPGCRHGRRWRCAPSSSTRRCSSGWAGTVLLIASIGQFFCTDGLHDLDEPDALRVQP